MIEVTQRYDSVFGSMSDSDIGEILTLTSTNVYRYVKIPKQSGIRVDIVRPSASSLWEHGMIKYCDAENRVVAFDALCLPIDSPNNQMLLSAHMSFDLHFPQNATHAYVLSSKDVPPRIFKRVF